VARVVDPEGQTFEVGIPGACSVCRGQLEPATATFLPESACPGLRELVSTRKILAWCPGCCPDWARNHHARTG